MERSFWEQRWEEGNTPWHKADPNPRLVAHFESSGVAPARRVLVPLCGKSVDLLWLRGRGLDVVGVELSEIAVRAVLDEAGLDYEVRDGPRVKRFESERLTLLCGDVFDVEAAELGAVDAVFDRAALVALPPGQRPGYGAHLLGLVSPGARLLVLGLEYRAGAIEGPPFSVGPQEVRRCFAGAGRVSVLDSREIIDEEPRLRARGLRSLVETAYLVEA